MEGNILRWLGHQLKLLWDSLGWWLKKFWLFFLLLMVLAFEGFKLVGDLTIRAFQAIATLTSNVGGGGFQAPCGSGLGGLFAIANTFFPLDETLRLIAALLVGVWLPCGLYRLLSSWIPVVGPKN